MSVYTYLYNLIKAAAKEAKQLREVDEDQLCWMYDQLHDTIYHAEKVGMISIYQRRKLFVHLDSVWGAPADHIDNGY